MVTNSAFIGYHMDVIHAFKYFHIPAEQSGKKSTSESLSVKEITTIVNHSRPITSMALFQKSCKFGRNCCYGYQNSSLSSFIITVFHIIKACAFIL